MDQTDLDEFKRAAMLLPETIAIGAYAYADWYISGHESKNPLGAWEEFTTYHAANFFDPAMGGVMVGASYILASGTVPANTEELHRLNVRAVFTAAGVGGLYELYQAQQPGRHFDYIDCGMYLAGALSFAVLSKAIKKTTDLIPTPF